MNLKCVQGHFTPTSYFKRLITNHIYPSLTNLNSNVTVRAKTLQPNIPYHKIATKAQKQVRVAVSK